MQDEVGGIKVDFESGLAWLGMICARCAAGLAVAFGLLQGYGFASFGLGLVVCGNAPQPTNPKPAQNLNDHIIEATRKPRQNQ